MKSQLQRLEDLPQLPRTVRLVLVITMHLGLFSAAYAGAFLVRFDFTISDQWEAVMWQTFPWVVGIKVLTFLALRNFQGWWKYVSFHDIIELGRSLAIASAVFVLLNVFVVDPPIYPRSIYVLDFGLSLFLIGAARGSLRLMREAVRRRLSPPGQAKNLLILGAGDTGETLLREITKNRNLPFIPVGFLDDDPYKRGLRIHGVPVIGPISSMAETVQKLVVEEVIIAMPSASREQMRRVVDIAKGTGAKTRILPAVESILEGHVSLNALRDVSIEDLLGREAVKLDTSSLARFIQGQTVLVTGAGGSIGSEICRQVLRFNPKSLVMVERAETPLFFIHRELSALHESLVPCITDVADEARMDVLMARHKPQVVIHAAAYKHVPLMELHPSQAVLNNVVGTQVLAKLSVKYDVKNFILISTDKAVNPSSVMGATKRITELAVLSQNEGTKTHFCAVRFGNVLGSNGSVVPIFREQIRKGGPVTVTHPEMTRYFMTIPEASQLVLQAAANGKGGELFILDMGAPVKIADLARDMIRLSGRTEEEVGIVYSGTRPGEKLFEELSLDEENFDKTRHEKIFVGRTASSDLEQYYHHVDALIECARHDDDLGVRRALKAIIPTYSWAESNVVELSKRRQTPML